ncbi:MAG: flagellar type III secretion system protein FlhB [Burkholderiales bacterium]|jgi:flagellar biosynthetic protein FlhB
MADSETSQDDKQLEASGKKLQQAREQGQIPRSRDLGHLAVMGAALGSFVLLGPAIGQGSIELLRHSLRFTRPAAMEPALMPELLGSLAGTAFWIILPCAAMAAVATICGAMAPGGISISTKSLEPDFSRLNPVTGLGRIFDKDALINLGKALLLAAVLVAVAVWFGRNRFAEYLGLGRAALPIALEHVRANLITGVALMLLVLFFASLFDVPWQWWRHRVKLRMTHEEAREEFKQAEGDPKIKGKIRARQREAAMARMIDAVAKADVVITNPTHYAVAIRYDESGMGAPRVIAKGIDHVAARIREAGQKAGVPMVEAPPLARALYARVDLDAEIPQALYIAVAQVLAYVYRLRHWVPGRGPMPAAPTDVPVPAGLDPKAGV